jgi:CheY-like chemotaxis protein
MPKTILLVEDSDDDVFLIARAFKNVGLISPVVRASHGQEAIDYLSGQGRYSDRVKFPFPALVLLDVKLPFVSGLEVLAWIREQSAFVGLPTIMFTTSNQDSDVKRAYAAGANAYIVKPANFEECTRLAGLIKQFWVESNVVPPIDLPANASTTARQATPAA